MDLKRLCVFCGSSRGARPEYAQAARELGATLARRGIELVYGGGCVGLMGELADAALGAGGRVIGVIPDFLMRREVGHRGASELRVVSTMHERKALMADLSDAFAALPGGLGTLEELCEVLTWSQLGLHAKPCGLLDVAGYWGPLFEVLDQAVREGFLPAAQRSLVLRAGTPDELLAGLERWRPVPVEKWLDRAGA